MARFALAAHERHGTHAVPHVIRSRRKKLLLAGLRALGPHMIGDTPVTLGERSPHLIGGSGRGAPGLADGHVCRELRQQINELARAPLPHLRENPANCGTHFLYHPMRLLAPGISEIHANNAPILGINVTRDPAFFSRDDSTVEMRPELACSADANCDGVCVPFMDSSRSTNCSPWAPRVNSLCIVERLPHTLAYSSLNCFLLKSHKSTIHSPFATRQSAANTPRISTHRKQFITRNYFGTHNAHTPRSLIF